MEKPPRLLHPSRVDALDGHRYELIDGTLVVTPAPGTRHQTVVVNLIGRLLAACPPELQVPTAPFDVRLADDTVLQPDVLVCRRADLTQRNLPTAPLLAVEVLSPSTRLLDRNFKRARYEKAGCTAYWVIDPDQPSVIAWTLVEGVYAETGRAVGADVFGAALPFPLEIVADELVR